LGSPVPPPRGDWVVRTPLVLADLTITLRGNLIVAPTGALALRRVELRLDGGRDGERRIDVQPGGRLSLVRSPVTNRGSRVSSRPRPGRYAFRVPPRARQS